MDWDKLKNTFNKVDDTLVAWNGAPNCTAGDYTSRRSQWKSFASNNALHPVEFLLPRILCHCPPDEPDFIVEGAEPEHISRAEAKAALDRMQPWGFYFRFWDMTTESPNALHSQNKSPMFARNRTICRSHLITSSVQRILGENIHNATFLDMGCNCGFFSLDIASRGAKSVHGVDFRADNIERANFVKSFYRMQNVDFNIADVLDMPTDKQYNVVYNLGLLYHVIDPFALMKKTYDLCTDFAVVDTVCHREPISAFIASYGKDNEHFGEGKFTAELQPTYRALIDIMHHVGFKFVVELVADTGRVSGFYRDHVRRCVIGFK